MDIWRMILIRYSYLYDIMNVFIIYISEGGAEGGAEGGVMVVSCYIL
jgi:hypothetical protein